MEFAQNLRWFMDKSGLSNYQLAKDLDVHPTTVANWLDGKIPRKKTLLQISEYFGVSLSRLRGDEDIEKTPTPEGERDIGFDDFTYAMQNETQTLTDGDKDLLLSLARQLNDARKKRNGEGN